MTDPQVVAASVVTVISALVIGVVTVINAIAAAAERRDARTSRLEIAKVGQNTEKKADTLIERTNEIHTLTNSNLTKVTEALNIALTRISGLETLVRSMTANKKIADDLAAITPGTRPQVVTEVLDKIEDNTKAIKDNTRLRDES